MCSVPGDVLHGRVAGCQALQQHRLAARPHIRAVQVSELPGEDGVQRARDLAVGYGQRLVNVAPREQEGIARGAELDPAAEEMLPGRRVGRPRPAQRGFLRAQCGAEIHAAHVQDDRQRVVGTQRRDHRVLAPMLEDEAQPPGGILEAIGGLLREDPVVAFQAP
jgi:hypothetical protein